MSAYFLALSGGAVPGERPRTAVYERMPNGRAWRMRWNGRRWIEQSRRPVSMDGRTVVAELGNNPTPADVRRARLALETFAPEVEPR